MGNQAVNGKIPLPYDIVEHLVELQNRFHVLLESGVEDAYDELQQGIPAFEEDHIPEAFKMFMHLNVGRVCKGIKKRNKLLFIFTKWINDKKEEVLHKRQRRE